MAAPRDNDVERESLKDEMRNVLEEARMVIPGVQALFGFQTMAVFNQKFDELSPAGVHAYLAGLGLMALAIALLMTPAAYHRIAERGQVSRRMIRLSSWLISLGMVPLMLALALDLYVVILAAIDDERIALVAAALGLVVFGACWFAFPLAWRKHAQRR